MSHCLEPPIVRVGFFWSNEPLVCDPQRTLYPSLIGNIVIYNSLLTCLLMFRMDYKYLMMLQEKKRRRLDEPLFVMYIGLRTCLLRFEMVYNLMMLPKQKGRPLDEPLFGTTYHHGGLFWIKEPLDFYPYRTFYPSLIRNTVIYNSLLTCLVMLRMDYKYLMMLQEKKRRRLDEPLFGTTYRQSGLFLEQRATCL